jgi:6-phosphogluconolactonase
MKSSKLDTRHQLIIPGSKDETIAFAAAEFIKQANQAIALHGFFAVALSGGSTPKSIFQILSSEKYRSAIDWKKVWLFWSDERAVPLDDKESNYHMAMEEGGLKNLPLLKENIFPMYLGPDLEKNAATYETLIKTKLKECRFDLIMLGMGEDGHTASLFPHTEALHLVNRLVAANFVPEKKSWRLTFTFELINKARAINLYALGESKSAIVHRVLTSTYDPDMLPSQRVGTSHSPAHFILDDHAASLLN